MTCYNMDALVGINGIECLGKIPWALPNGETIMKVLKLLFDISCGS